ncbi:MAG: CPBP family intramembrane glutamic endopeptidase [Hyphomicrobiaceae bacterium]|jgi:membrane protease YdiL (CAAX protease family)
MADQNSVPASVLRILQFPLVRLVLLGAILFYLYISGHMFRGAFVKGWLPDLLVVAWMAGFTLAVYVGFVHAVERRPASEFATPGMGRELGLGMLLGAGLYTVCIVMLMLLGVYRPEGIGSWYILLAVLWFALSSGFFEELLFRGVLFRISQDTLGSWAAVVISSVAFGLIHLNNPGASLQGVLFIAVGAGVVLAAAYMLTGRLWMSMGFHMAWNYTQAAVFPLHVSGSGTSQALVKASISGPDLLTGGIYGMESSIVSLAILAMTAVILLVLAIRRGKVVGPSWMRAD